MRRPAAVSSSATRSPEKRSPSFAAAASAGASGALPGRYRDLHLGPERAQVCVHELSGGDFGPIVELNRPEHHDCAGALVVDDRRHPRHLGAKRLPAGDISPGGSRDRHAVFVRPDAHRVKARLPFAAAAGTRP